jgi:hypothetical protein
VILLKRWVKVRPRGERVGGDGNKLRNARALSHEIYCCTAPHPLGGCIVVPLRLYQYTTLHDGAQEEERAAGRGGQQRDQRQRVCNAARRLEARHRVDQEAGKRALDVGPHHLPQQVGGSLIGAPVAYTASNPLTTGIGAISRRSTGPGCSSPPRSSSPSHTATTSPRAHTPSTPPSSTTWSRSARPSTRPPISPCVRRVASPRPR